MQKTVDDFKPGERVWYYFGNSDLGNYLVECEVVESLRTDRKAEENTFYSKLIGLRGKDPRDLLNKMSHPFNLYCMYMYPQDVYKTREELELVMNLWGKSYSILPFDDDNKL